MTYPRSKQCIPINFTYNNIKYPSINNDFSYKMYPMQYFLESNNHIFSIIKFILLFSGIYISLYGHSNNFLVSTIFIQSFLFILVEEIYEAFPNEIIIDERLGMFLFIFSLIIGGALGILFNLKLSKSLPFIYTFSSLFTVSRILIYLLPFLGCVDSQKRELFYYSYQAISIVIAIFISTAILYSKSSIQKFTYLVTSSIIGPYIIICGLSYIVGGIVFIKIKMYFEENELSFNSKNEYIFIYLSFFILSITFQLFHKSFDIRKEKIDEEIEQFKKMNSNDTSSSLNYIRPRLSTEMENNFRPSDVGKMIPDESNIVTHNEEPYTEEVQEDEGYVNEENLE